MAAAGRSWARPASLPEIRRFSIASGIVVSPVRGMAVMDVLLMPLIAHYAPAAVPQARRAEEPFQWASIATYDLPTPGAQRRRATGGRRVQRPLVCNVGSANAAISTFGGRARARGGAGEAQPAARGPRKPPTPLGAAPWRGIGPSGMGDEHGGNGKRGGRAALSRERRARL